MTQPSPGRELLKAFGSLKLAIVLMVHVIVLTAWGTRLESYYNADVAKRWVYNSPFFDLLLVLLCVNIFAAAAVRYPWKPHLTGFVITHAGIITLLAGGMVDRHFGIEGFLHLYKGQPPSNVMELHDQRIDISTLSANHQVNTVSSIVRLKAYEDAASVELPLKTPTQGMEAHIVQILNVQPAVELEVAERGNPAVMLVLTGAMMGRFEQPLFIGDQRDMGMASISFQRGLPPEKASKTPKEGAKRVPSMERHFVFAKHPDQNIVATVQGEATGSELRLELDENNQPILLVNAFGNMQPIDVKAKFRTDVELDKEKKFKLRITDYFPDMVMVKGGPMNRSPDPLNPTVLVEITGPLVAEEDRTPKPGAGHAGHGGSSHGTTNQNAIDIYLGDDNKLRYQVKSRGVVTETGETEAGKFNPVSWGKAGVEFSVAQFLPVAVPKKIFKPLAAGAAHGPGATPGVQIRLKQGSESKDIWIGQSLVAEREWRSLEMNGRPVKISMANDYRLLPFRVGLKHFSAPTDEGLTGSTSFMAFESTLSFENQVDTVKVRKESPIAKEKGTDVLLGSVVEEEAERIVMVFDDRPDPVKIARSDVVSIEMNTHKIHTNYPTNYPIDWYGPFLGTAWKFSQANHDMPRNPNYSGVQVLRDPGWLPKWIGSLLICFGIITMFWLKPYFNFKKGRPASGAASDKVELGKAAQKAVVGAGKA